jgi:hypothetical protein
MILDEYFRPKLNLEVIGLIGNSTIDPIVEVVGMMRIRNFNTVSFKNFGTRYIVQEERDCTLDLRLVNVVKVVNVRCRLH